MRFPCKSGYAVRFAETPSDIRAAQELRGRAFLSGTGMDADDFDARCSHILVERVAGGELVCCFRVLPIETGRDIDKSYSAQFYDLGALSGFDAPMVEMGRFCIAPGLRDPDILRVAWGAMADLVLERQAEMLFGCSSFQGTDTKRYYDAFAVLRERHLAPKRWLPRVKAPRVFNFARRLRRRPDLTAAMRTMPPLLKTYLMMGGWVSDHAVVDREMDTLHVFTGLEVSAIPAARRRSILGAG